MTSKQILFFLPKRAMNEATIFYVDIIKFAFKRLDYEVIESESLKDVVKYKNIFVMSAKWFFLVKLANPTAKITTWFQGVGSEEVLMNHNSKSDRVLWIFVEYLALNFSWLNIYVSKSMRDYYLNTYKMKNEDYFIMPCFNKELNVESFSFPGKYTNPSFVYAGSLDKWQCIDETLSLYSKIEKEIPNANLTLLTKDRERAIQLIKKYEIRNSNVKFVALDRLDEELKSFKYGFLIRENHIVNNVSTPTKMSSYLANGIIPIYTNVIKDFNVNIDSECFVSLNYKDNTDIWASKILISHNSTERNIDSFKKEVYDLFSIYYSKENYITLLSNKIINLE